MACPTLAEIDVQHIVINVIRNARKLFNVNITPDMTLEFLGFDDMSQIELFDPIQSSLGLHSCMMQSLDKADFQNFDTVSDVTDGVFKDL